MVSQVASTGTQAQAESGAAQTATGAQAGGESGSQRTVNQADFDLGYGKAAAKFEAQLQAANAAREAAERQLAANALKGKSVEELQKELEARDGKLSEASKNLEAKSKRIQSFAEARAKALPDNIRSLLEKAAGGDPDRMLDLLPDYEALAGSTKAAPQGGALTSTASFGLEEYDRALNAGDMRAVQAFRQKHGTSAVDAALKARSAKR